jgi:hypothetical protein
MDDLQHAFDTLEMVVTFGYIIGAAIFYVVHHAIAPYVVKKIDRRRQP